MIRVRNCKFRAVIVTRDTRAPAGNKEASFEHKKPEANKLPAGFFGRERKLVASFIEEEKQWPSVN